MQLCTSLLVTRTQGALHLIWECALGVWKRGGAIGYLVQERALGKSGGASPRGRSASSSS